MNAQRYADLLTYHKSRNPAAVRAALDRLLVGNGFTCLECGKRFRSAQSAMRASNEGCPKCGSVDVDLA
jgi:rubrerythrin